jgi:hypothetical protein
MLSPVIIREIEQLLEEGQLTRRKIAIKVGVARSTVTAVAERIRQADDYLQHAPTPKPLAKARRCPSCGATVRMPCKLCQTRELVAGGRLPPPKPVVAASIGLQLKPEHQARYAEVRRWRREALRLGVIIRPHPDPLTPDP